MAKTRIGSNAIFTGPQTKGISYLGDRCYAYSGIITTSTSFQTFLEFNTGKEITEGTLQITADLNSLGSSFLQSQVSINGIVISFSSMERHNFDWEVTPLLLPPLSTVKVEVLAQGGAPQATVMFIAKVHA